MPLTADAGLTRYPESYAGLTRYPESYADVTSLQPAARSRFRRRRGLLATAELTHLEDRLRVHLGL